MNKGESSLAVEIEMEIDGDHEVGLVHCLLVCLEKKNAKHILQCQI